MTDLGKPRQRVVRAPTNPQPPAAPLPASPLSHVQPDDTTFGDIADAAKIPVIVDLWAPWCGPCRMVSPALEQLTRDLAGRVKLVKVNVDVSPQLSRRFGAQAIPTLLVLRGGQVAARQTGAAPLAALRAWVDKALATAAP